MLQLRRLSSHGNCWIGIMWVATFLLRSRLSTEMGSPTYANRHSLNLSFSQWMKRLHLLNMNRCGIPLQYWEVQESIVRLRTRSHLAGMAWLVKCAKSFWGSCHLMSSVFMSVVYWRAISLLSGRLPGSLCFGSRKKNRNNPRSYRTISLLPALVKVLKEIMVERQEVKTSNLVLER